jgi:plastocyanin
VMFYPRHPYFQPGDTLAWAYTQNQTHALNSIQKVFSGGASSVITKYCQILYKWPSGKHINLIFPTWEV